ncbi:MULTISPECIES: MFS transporter [unclassified Aeromicrobium]|uniref:MFS transporter n=1 Tax=unclassified Aeromicrobium TaxID=2633570 RepID=UPI00396B3A18
MTASGLATWALPCVLGLAVVEGALTGTQLGVALAARTIGFLTVLPVAGVLADRHRPRIVVAWSSGVAAIGSAPLAATDLAGPLVPVALLLAGAGQGACRPAFQSLVPRAVPEHDRQAANAAISVSVRTSVLAGPAVAGLASAALGPQPVLGALVALWTVSALLPPWPSSATRDRSPGTGSSGSPRGFAADFVEGLREARRHPWLVVGLAALAAVITTGYSITAVALPLVSGSTTLLAAASTAYTAGALVGASVIARWRPRSAGWCALAGLGAYALAPASLAAGLPPVGIVAAYVVVGFGIEMFNVPWFTAIQREIPPDRLARVSSLDFLLSYGLAPVGLAATAPAIDQFGVTPVLVATTLVCVLGPLGAACVPTSRHFRAATGASAVATTSAPCGPSSGGSASCSPASRS